MSNNINDRPTFDLREDFREACINGNMQAVKEFLNEFAQTTQQKININDVISTGLIKAAEFEELEIVDLLLEYGAMINFDDNRALIHSCSEGHLSVVKYLVEHDAHIYDDAEDGLCWACNNGRADIVQYLIDKEANIHIHDGKPIQWALEAGKLEVVKLLVEHGANVYVNNNESLETCARNGYVDVVLYLIEKDVSPEIFLNTFNREVENAINKVVEIKMLSEKLRVELNVEKETNINNNMIKKSKI